MPGPVVVIGAGLAGLRAAEVLAKGGATGDRSGGSRSGGRADPHRPQSRVPLEMGAPGSTGGGQTPWSRSCAVRGCGLIADRLGDDSGRAGGGTGRRAAGSVARTPAPWRAVSRPAGRNPARASVADMLTPRGLDPDTPARELAQAHRADHGVRRRRGPPRGAGAVGGQRLPREVQTGRRWVRPGSGMLATGLDVRLNTRWSAPRDRAGYGPGLTRRCRGRRRAAAAAAGRKAGHPFHRSSAGLDDLITGNLEGVPALPEALVARTSRSCRSCPPVGPVGGVVRPAGASPTPGYWCSGSAVVRRPGSAPGRRDGGRGSRRCCSPAFG